ncbi:VWA domain-containing protein [Dinoroseobacter sp. S124A]|uniref:VWA domain-containing protein n=1 Tax=Dinoroseobacter sp. S124A TaxID=3415128 RepID=UPI003C7C6781
MSIAFATPWILLMLPLPLLVWWLVPPHRERTAALRIPFFRSVTAATGVRAADGARVLARSRLQVLATTLCWILIVVGLARPERLGDPITVTNAARDLILAVDISGSMDDRDMETPEGDRVQRLQAVKDVVRAFVAEREGDRIALIVFGANAYVQVPFTEDLDSVAELLEQTQTGMAGPNTAIGDAIGLAIRAFEDSEIEERLLILLSDGADTASAMSPINAAEIAADAQITIYTIGVGNPDGSGEERLDPATLEDIARRGGGAFYYATDVEGLAEIYAEIDTLNPRVTDSATYQPREPISHIPFALALLIGVLTSAYLHLARGQKAAA